MVVDKFKILLKSELEKLPKTTGVYLLASPKPAGGGGFDVIYIGKAINIQNRVKNHFNQPSYRDNLFIDKVAKIGFFETSSEIEALILEANLIKKYQPKFNVVWRDDKNYFWVAVLQNENRVPYVFVTHQPKNFQFSKSNFQSNPKSQFSNSKNNYVGPFVEGVALKKTLRFLRKAFPYYTARRHSKNKCTYCHLGLCPGPSPDLKEYKKNIKKLILILKGKRNTVLNLLKKEMKQFSKENKFEEAGRIRDKISALQQVMSHTHVINNPKVGVRPDLTRILSEILRINKNIHRIECYDVSNIQGKQATGSMVVFVGGKPDKSQYRKFRIRMKNEPNDIAMLKETITRRLSHAEWDYPDVMLIDGGRAQLNAAINSKSEARFNSAELQRSGSNPKQIQNIKIISIAKRNKELFVEGKNKPVLLKTLPREIYNLILQLDDEAHRFAIAYHKKLRKKELLK